MNKYFFIFFIIHFISFSQERRITRDANKYFLEDKDSLAIDNYKKAIDYNDKFNIPKFNLANTLYSQAKYKESIKLLDEVISSEKSELKKANAYYNKGKNEIAIYENSENEDKKEFLENAIESFKESLRNNPHDDNTRFNLAKSISMLKDLDNQNSEDNSEENEKDQDENSEDNSEENKKDQDENSEENSEENKKDQDKNSDEKSEENGSKSGQTDGESENGEKKEQMQEAQMNQILNAVEQKEREVKGKAKNINAMEIKMNTKKIEKDW